MAIKCLARIRNQFAHNWEKTSFDDEAVVKEYGSSHLRTLSMLTERTGRNSTGSRATSSRIAQLEAVRGENMPNNALSFSDARGFDARRTPPACATESRAKKTSSYRVQANDGAATRKCNRVVFEVRAKPRTLTADALSLPPKNHRAVAVASGTDPQLFLIHGVNVAIYKEWLQRCADKKVSRSALLVESIEGLAKIWAILGAGAFVISGGYWFEFRHVYAIPVSIGSATALGSLPILFGMVVLATLSLSIYLLGPSMAMWMEVDIHGRRLIDGHRFTHAGRVRNPFRTDDLSRAWIASQLAVVAIVAACNKLMTGTDWASGVVFVSALAIACLLSIQSLRRVRTRVGIKGGGAVLSNVLIVWATIIQCWVVVGLGQGVFDLAKRYPDVSEAACWAIFLVLCICSISAQYAFSRIMRRRLNRDALKILPFVVLGLAAAPLMVPPLAARLATPVYRTTAPGGGKCVRLIASKKVDPDDWKSIASSTSLDISDNLDLVVQMDGYQVKRHLDEDTVTLAVDQVRRVTPCDPPTGTKDRER